MIEKILENKISTALESCGFSDVEGNLEHPALLEHGDYSSNIALVLGKRENKNPREVAELIVNALGVSDEVEKVEIAGPGFINFYLSRTFFLQSVRDILEKGETWGANKS